MMKSLNIRLQQAVLITTAQITTVAIFAIITLIYTANILLEIQHSDHDRRINLIERTASYFLQNDQSESLKPALTSLLNTQMEAGAVVIYSSDKAPLLTSNPSKLDIHTQPLVALYNKQGALLGFYQLELHDMNFQAWLSASLIAFIVAIGVSLTVAPILASRLDRLTVLPIKNITALTREISEKHDYKQRIELRSGEEVNELAAAINSMLDQVEVSEQQLKNYGNYIEESVQDELHQLKASVKRDPLTQMANRATLMNEGSTIIRDALARGEFTYIILADIMRLQAINQTFGHRVGDLVITTIATRISETGCHSYRVGGDEFAVLIQGKRTDEAQSKINHLKSVLNSSIEWQGQKVHIQSAIGMAIAPDHGTDISELLRRADTAVQDAKSEGSHSPTEYNGKFDYRRTREFTLEQDLKRAIDEEEFYLEYQPKMDTKKKSIVGVEALCRWHHSELGRIPPCEFIAISEKANLSRKLGNYVLNKALQQMQQWHSEGFDISVAVNISPAQLTSPLFLNDITNALSKYTVAPSKLELEITENVFISDTYEVSNKIDTIRALGVTVAIDDFGTGYSSLNYLRHFTVDIIKLDASFIHDIATDTTATGIVDAVLSLSHTMGFKVVAEGVETADQSLILNTLGCDYLQGHLIAKALSPDDFIQFLNTYRQSY